MANTKLKLFSGTSHPQLAQEIARLLKVKLSPIEIKRFACNEIYVKPLESVRDTDVFLIQSGTQNVNEDLIELFIMIDSFKRSFATEIHVVIPHFPYARQDRVAQPREPITAKLMADLVSKAGADHVITMALHSDQEQGFFDFPVDNLSARRLFANYFLQKRIKDLVVVAPDVGSAKEADRFSKLIGADLAILNKIRPSHNIAEVTHVVGDVHGRPCLMYDDMVDTGGSVVGGINVLRKQGARDVYLAATHAVLSRDAAEHLQKADFKEILFTDTIPMESKKKLKNLKILSVAPLLASVIKNVHSGKPLTPLHSS